MLPVYVLPKVEHSERDPMHKREITLGDLKREQC